MAELAGTDERGAASMESCIAKAVSSTPAGIPAADLLGRWPISLRGAVLLIAELRSSFADQPPDIFVERVRTTWLAEVSAAARFLGRFRRARLDRFFLDLEQRLVKGEGGVVGLARFLRQAVGDGQPGAVAGEPDLQANAVHVMTIHSAKGLDFGHVYLVQVHRQSNSGGQSSDPKVLPLGNRREYRVFGWPTPDFPRAEELKNRQSSAEMIRLLYVALTRAKERLVVSGGRSEGPQGGDPLNARSFSELLDSRVEAEALLRQLESNEERRVEENGRVQWFVPALGGRKDAGDVRERSVNPGLKTAQQVRDDGVVLAAARAAAAERMARPLTGGASSLEREVAARHDADGGESEVSPETDRDVARTVGTALHGMLEDLDPTADLDVQLHGMLNGAIAEMESRLGRQEFTAARTRLTELVHRVGEGRCLERLGEISANLVGREIAIAAPPDPEVGPVGAITGFVDLVYRDPVDGRLVVADYKTDEVAGEGSVAERVHVYEPQVRIYARALRDALDLDHEPHIELWFLAADRIVRL